MTACDVFSCFHPLYRGTWFPTVGSLTSGCAAQPVSIRYIAVLGFQLGLMPTPQSRLLPFPSAISRYLVSNQRKGLSRVLLAPWFPSAISRYLVSNFYQTAPRRTFRCGFHPLYRGTWFPTKSGRQTDPRGGSVSIRYIAVLGFQPVKDAIKTEGGKAVSIRYIAVLGFQPYQKNTPSDQRRRKRFTHPPSNRSHSHICFLKSR